jgi:hypothetical protein
MDTFMKEFFANIAIGGATVTAFLTLLDWFLTDKQKERLSLLSIRLWNWLDDLYRRRFFEWFYKGRPQLVVAALAVISYVTLGLSLLVFRSVPFQKIKLDELALFAIPLILGPTLAVVIFRPLLRWLSHSKSQLTYLIRLYATILAFILVVMPFWYAADRAQIISNSIPHWAEMPWLIAGLSAMTIYGTFFMLWTFLCATTISLFCAKTIVYASTFIMRRIAESKKGPILGISALVGGIAAIVKAMQ